MFGSYIRRAGFLMAMAAAIFTTLMIAAPVQAQDEVGPSVYPGDGPRGRVIAFILQAEPRSPSEASLREAIDGVVDELFGQSSVFNPDNDQALASESQQIIERTKNSFPLAPNTEPLLFRVFDVPVLVVPVPQPLPRQEFVADWQDRRQFPDAAQVLDQHQAHSIIFALLDPQETAQQVRAAEAVSAVAAAFSTSENTLGVHWGESDMALPPASLTGAFEQASAEAAAAKEAGQPIKPSWHRLLTLWINIRPANAGVFRAAYTDAATNPVPAELDDTAIGFATKGLASFIGREIEMVPSGRPAAEQALALVNLLAYLLDRGQVLQDNDTLGFTAERSIQSTIVTQSQLPGLTETPILRLNYLVEDAAPDSE